MPNFCCHHGLQDVCTCICCNKILCIFSKYWLSVWLLDYTAISTFLLGLVFVSLWVPFLSALCFAIFTISNHFLSLFMLSIACAICVLLPLFPIQDLLTSYLINILDHGHFSYDFCDHIIINSIMNSYSKTLSLLYTHTHLLNS